jgi:branched-chain amino acid transport system substrate-binding protein
LRRSLLLTAAAIAALGCHSQPKEYVIGAAGPQKVPIGIANQHGIDLAVEEINRAGGIHGIPLRVVVRDDHGAGDQAAQVASGFIDDTKVLGVVGHLTSGAMVSAAPIYHSGQLVAIATSASSPDLTGISPWVFRMNTSDSTNGVALARFAASFERSTNRPVRVAIIYQNDAYGRGLADAFERSFTGEIVSDDPISSTTNMEPYVSFFKQRKVDLVFVASDEAAGHPFLNEARRQGLTCVILGGDGWQPITDDPKSEGVYMGVPFTAQSKDTAAQRFVAAYQAKYGSLPNALAALAYDATKLLATAIGASNGTRADVRKYLANLNDTHAYHGVSGTTWFNSNNDPAGTHFHIVRVTKGLMLPVADTGSQP